jgi:hypothetical protein
MHHATTAKNILSDRKIKWKEADNDVVRNRSIFLDEQWELFIDALCTLVPLPTDLQPERRGVVIMHVFDGVKVFAVRVAHSITHGGKVCKVSSPGNVVVPSQMAEAMTGPFYASQSRSWTSRLQVPSKTSGGLGCSNENGHWSKAGDARWAYSSQSDAHNVQDDDWTLVRRPTRRSRQEAIAPSTGTKDSIGCLDKTMRGWQPSVMANVRRRAILCEAFCDDCER